MLLAKPPAIWWPPNLSILQEALERFLSPHTGHILTNTSLTLLVLSGATLLNAERLLADYECWQALITVLEDGPVKKFRVKEFEQYTKNVRTEAVSPIQNKVG